MPFKKMVAACLLGGVLVFASLSAKAGVLINEIHFDDAETPSAGNQIEAVNVLPTLVSSDPANNGSYELHAFLERSFSVTFSQPVSIDPEVSPYSIACSLSQNLMVQADARPGMPPTTTHTLIASSNVLGTRPFQVGDVCALTLHSAAFINSADAHPAANIIVNFTVVAAPPSPPYVSGTSLSNGYPQTRSANYFIRFSESVTLTTSAFTLQCSVSGSVALDFPTSGIDYTISKPISLQNGETCVFTAHASEITNSDNMHPHMDYVVTFPIAPFAGTGPSVVSTTPTHNATGVPGATDIRVVFSEMVGVDHESFVLNCGLSGVVPLRFNNKMLAMANGAGRAVTMVSDKVLQAGETCTLTVIAAGVTDDDDLAMSQDKLVSFKIAGGIVSAYYAPVNTSNAEQLRCTLNTIIRGHTVYPYSAITTDTWDILEIADEDPNNPGNILDLYKNRSYTKITDRAGTGSGVTYNREHTWPNSLGFGSQTGNLGLPHGPYTDTHMLYLSDTDYNANRGNSPYSYCTQAAGCAERATEINNGSGGGTGVYPGNSNWHNANAFETWSKRQGDVARAVMYMAIRYEGGTHGTNGQNEPDLELTDNAGLIVGTSTSPAYMGLLTDLLLWHQADPPDAAEVARNEVIYTFQGNRNPFIDHPEWGIEALFTSAKPASCTLNTNSSNPIKRQRPIPATRPRQSTRN